MAQSGAYKQYARGTRSLILEEGFSKGMCSNSIPLADGQFKTIVNYQIQEDGRQLVPRKGRKIDITGTTQMYRPADTKIVTVLSADAEYKSFIINYTDPLDSDPKISTGCSLFITSPILTTAAEQLSAVHIGKWTVAPNSTLNYAGGAYLYGLSIPAYPTEEISLPDGSKSKAMWTNTNLFNGYIKLNGEVRTLEHTVYTYDTEDGSYTDQGFVPFSSDTCAINKTLLGPVRDGEVGITVYSDGTKFKPIPRPVYTMLNGVLCTIMSAKFSVDWTDVAYGATSAHEGSVFINDTTIRRALNNGKQKTRFVKGTIKKLYIASNFGEGFVALPYHKDVLTIADVSPKVPSFAEAYSATGGFNMLLDNPYEAKNVSGSAYELIGALLYEDAACTKLATTYKVGQRVYAHPTFYYTNSAATLTSVCKINGNDPSTDIVLGVNTINGDTDVVVALDVPAESFNLAFTIMASGNLVLSDASFPFSGGAENANTYGSTMGLEAVNYDLTTATGMLTWKQRVVLWGVEKAGNLIFTSLPNRLDYFPFPNGVIEVPSHILHVCPFNDALLIFTTSNIYKASLSPDGSGTVIELVAADVNMTYDDTYAIVPVKKMLFYKSGNYYYMLVPSTKYATLGELNVAAVSAPINYFLDHFTDEVKSIIINMYSEELNYPKPEDITITPDLYNAYLANTDVCLDHVLNITVGETTYNVSLILKYNTILRTWSIDLIGLTNNYVQLAIKNVAGVPVYSTYTDSTEIRLAQSFKPDMAETVDASVTSTAAVSLIGQGAFTTKTTYTLDKPVLPMLLKHLDSIYIPMPTGPAHSGRYIARDVTSFIINQQLASTGTYYGFLLNSPTTELPEGIISQGLDVGPLIYWCNDSSAASPTISTIYSLDTSNTPRSFMLGYTGALFSVATSLPVFLTDDIDNCNDTFVDNTLPTKQFLDTGYRAFNIANKKRMREVQFKVNNKLGVPLQFKTGFILDNERRVDLSNYTLDINSDGQFIVNSTAAVSNVTPVDVTGESVFVNDADDLGLNENAWYLDKSNLTVNDTATVRWRVSGKGYLPRITLLSENIKSYELLGIGWAARLMNTR